MEQETATVTEVVDDFAKHGHSEKTGKDWSMSRVGLSNGESVFIFNPIQVGDVVESKQNGEYKNWSKKKVDPKQEQLDRIEALLVDIKARLMPNSTSASKPVQNASTQATHDTVHPVDDEPINLDDYPL